MASPDLEGSFEWAGRAHAAFLTDFPVRGR
jgi:hypothetical protein